MPNNVEFRIEGLAELRNRLIKSRDAIVKEVSGELYRFAEEIMADSKAVVPVQTGALMNTGKVMPPVQNGSRVTVTLGYGDTSVGYAIYVHENLVSPSGNAINYTRPGSGPKYLENPLKAKQAQLPGRIKAAVLRAI